MQKTSGSLIREQKRMREKWQRKERAFKIKTKTHVRRNNRYRKFALRSTETFQPPSIEAWTKPTLRRFLFERQKGLCHYCQKRMILFSTCKEGRFCTIDHVVPKICGGEHRLNNVVGACFECNQEKWNRDDIEHYVDRLFRDLTETFDMV